MIYGSLSFPVHEMTNRNCFMWFEYDGCLRAAAKEVIFGTCQVTAIIFLKLSHKTFFKEEKRMRRCLGDCPEVWKSEWSNCINQSAAFLHDRISCLPVNLQIRHAVGERALLWWLCFSRHKEGLPLLLTVDLIRPRCPLWYITNCACSLEKYKFFNKVRVENITLIREVLCIKEYFIKLWLLRR